MKENVYLMMHTSHFDYLYMVMDQSDNKRGNLLPPVHGV